MMYKGSLFWKELTPRMRTVLRPPGEPPFSTVTPETRPSRRWSTLADVCFCAFSTLTLDTAPLCLIAGDDDFLKHSRRLFERDVDRRPSTHGLFLPAIADEAIRQYAIRRSGDGIPALLVRHGSSRGAPDADRDAPQFLARAGRGDDTGDLHGVLSPCRPAHTQCEQHAHHHRTTDAITL